MLCVNIHCLYTKTLNRKITTHFNRLNEIYSQFQCYNWNTRIDEKCGKYYKRWNITMIILLPSLLLFVRKLPLSLLNPKKRKKNKAIWTLDFERWRIISHFRSIFVVSRHIFWTKRDLYDFEGEVLRQFLL